MATRDALGDRMKQNYENITRNYLTRRVPAIIRLDGKAFHTFTKGMRKPFDDVLTKTMQDTMKYLCEHIQGCVLGYTQSDEITLVLTDYATIKTDAWYGYNVLKMTSVAASMATLAFNQNFPVNVDTWCNQAVRTAKGCQEINKTEGLFNTYASRTNKALFDARVFSVPKDEVCNCLIWRQQDATRNSEVCNCLIWRQQDATRNSIEAVGQAFFSQKELHKKTQSDIQEMLWSKFGVNWNNFPTENKRGSCCIKQAAQAEIDDPRNPGQKITVTRKRWEIDTEIPIFTQDRAYIEKLL